MFSKFKNSSQSTFEPQTKSRARQALDRAIALGDHDATRLAEMVATSHGVTVEELFHHSRSRAPIAATRQLAMYLMHVLLGRNLTEVGVFFGRDRTTVSYACALVEDMREDPKFEAEVCGLESAFELEQLQRKNQKPQLRVVAHV